MKRIYADSSKPAPWDSFNYYANTPKFCVSYMKVFLGTRPRNKRLGLRLPAKVDRNYSWCSCGTDMYNGSVKGMLAFGMNA